MAIASELWTRQLKTLDACARGSIAKFYLGVLDFDSTYPLNCNIRAPYAVRARSLQGRSSVTS
jgi:hypothetical protein